MRQLLEYDPVIGHRFIPGLKARVEHEAGGYLVQVNQAGFRCSHDFHPKIPSGMKRMLLFGDSFTAGDGVSNNKRFGDLLESMIPNLQVYNFGLSGSGTDQQYLIFEQYAKDIDFDLCVIALYVENVRRVAAHYRPYLNDRGEEVYYAKPYYQIEDGDLALKHVPPNREPLSIDEIPADHLQAVDTGGRFPLLRQVVKKAGMQRIAQALTHYQPLPDYDRSDNPNWQLMNRILTKWVGAQPQKFLVLPIPLHQHIEGTCDATNYQARLSEFQKDVGCYLYNPLPDLQSYSKDDIRAFRFEKDPHFTASGHEALAGSMKGIIESILSTGDQQHG